MALNELAWHPEALTDALEARNWYAEQSPRAARGFLLTLDTSIKTVLEAPERWPKHRYGCRRYVFSNRYPYTLIYRIVQDGVVEIVAVAHHKQRPYYWKNR